MPLTEVVENLKLSLVGHRTKLSMCMSSTLVSIDNCEVVTGGTLPNFRCACQRPLVCDHNVVTVSGETLHGVSVVSIQELAGNTIVLRHERHAHSQC